jgi:signal transduction histidine kinase
MNAILGFSQVLLSQRKSLLGDREKHILQRILSNGRSLMALINDILDFSQMKLTELKLMPSTFDIENLVTNIIEELQSLADEKQLHLRLFVELDNPQITHDQKRIRQVLVNLIANALSFTQQGTVDIVLRDEDDKIYIDVKDTGIGIAPEDLDHIFSEFWQVQQDLHRTNSGTGLGLAITHSLVQRMQGAIAVESVANRGSKFTVTLPRTLTLQETAGQ